MVLMDLEMPGLGGTETTARIREREANRGGHVPIVAMTAHALEGDRERCLAAGMDDYLAKPIRAAALFAVVEQFGPHGANEPWSMRSTAVRERASVEHRSVKPEAARGNAFDRDEALAAAGNDSHLLADLIGIFLADCPKWIRDLDGAIRDRRADDARRIAHSIKNSAGYFGALRVRELALAMEQTATGGDLGEAPKLLGELTGELDRLASELVRCRDELVESRS